MTATILKLRRKNSCSLKPYSVSSQPMLVTKPRYPPGLSRLAAWVKKYAYMSDRPGQLGLARPLGAEQLRVVGLVDLADGLLPNVRRIADDGVHLLQGDHLLPAVRQRPVVHRIAPLGVEEARLCHERIVRLVAQVPDGQVDGGELGREGADVYPEYLVEQPPVRERRSAGGLCERALSRVGPHEERASAARRVQHPVVRAAHAEGVDEVDDVRRSVELAEPTALGSAYELLVHSTDHVEVQAREVELLDAPDQARPVSGRHRRQKGKRVTQIAFVRLEHGLVVV